MVRPLRLIQGNSIILITDSNYKVSRYELVYLRRPRHIYSNDDLTQEYTDLPAMTHMEIVKLAVRLYAANKPNQNYNLLAQETQVME